MDIKCTTSADASMDITSNHLDVVVSSNASGYGDDNGDELTKRVEHFGWPAYKGDLVLGIPVVNLTTFHITRRPEIQTYSDSEAAQGPGDQATLHRKKGKFNRVRFLRQILMAPIGNCERACQMVPLLGGFVRI